MNNNVTVDKRQRATLEDGLITQAFTVKRGFTAKGEPWMRIIVDGRYNRRMIVWVTNPEECEWVEAGTWFKTKRIRRVQLTTLCAAKEKLRKHQYVYTNFSAWAEIEPCYAPKEEMFSDSYDSERDFLVFYEGE